MRLLLFVLLAVGLLRERRCQLKPIHSVCVHICINKVMAETKHALSYHATSVQCILSVTITFYYISLYF